jgi:hypothetical protein
MQSEDSFPRLQAATSCTYPEQSLSPYPRPFEMFRDILSLYGVKLLALRPNLKLEDHPLSRVLDWLFSVGHSQLPEAVPPSSNRGRALMWWQGPTFFFRKFTIVAVGHVLKLLFPFYI